MTEKRLIDANAYKASLTKWKEDAWKHNERHDAMLIADCLCELELTRTVDAVEVVHGWWECEHGSWGKMQCSNCKKEALLEKSNGDVGTILLYVTSNYCPNCGAKMHE